MTEEHNPNDRNYATCAACGRLTHIDDLDSKPENLDDFDRPRFLHEWIARIFFPAAWRLVTQKQIVKLERAARFGGPFERLECESCYGPGYSSL